MATEPLITVKNAAAKLDPKLAFFLPNSEAQSVPLSNAKEVRVAWAFSTDDNFAELEQFLTLYTWPTNTDQERRFVVDPNVGGTPLPGTWRQAFITRIERRGDDRQEEMLVVLTLRRGWAEAIDWTEALFVSSRDADGNSESVPGVDNTSSYNDASALVVRFPNISPYKIRQCMAQFADSTYTNVTVQNTTLTDVWHKAFVAGRTIEDGSGVVDLVLSRERFTVSLYNNYGTITQASIYKIYDVTRDIAQQIVTDWQAEGRSADISLSGDTELCLVTLIDRDAAKDNLSTDWIKDACDKFIRYHFAWGYSKEELAAWIKVHDGVLNDPAVPGDEGADTQPITRRLSVRERGDGLFNAEIEERKFDNSDPTSPDFTISLPIGTTTTRVQEYGWNFKYSEINADAIKNRYDETARAIGKTVQFDITRDDDCSFDFRAVITSVISTSSDLTATGTGITSKVITGRHLDGTGEKAAIEALVATAPRKRVSLDLNIGEDDSKQYKARIDEVTETNDYVKATTGAGIQVSVTAHKNVDPEDIATLGEAAIRDRVSASLSPNDDGSVDAVIQKQTVVETAGTELSTSGTGIQVASISHKNRDPRDITTLGVTAIRERVSASVSPNDDGSIDAIVQKVTAVETNDYTKATTGAGIQTSIVAHKNVDPGDITSLGAVGIRERLSASVSPNDDGSIDAITQKQTVVETAGTPIATTGAGIQVAVTAHKNRDVGDVTTLGTAAIRERVSASVQVGDDGAQDITIQKQTLVETNDYTKATTVGIGETAGIQVAVTAHKNADPTDIADLGTAHIRERVSASLSPNDDGSVDAVIQKQTVVETAGTELSTTGTGIQVTTISHKNRDPGDITTLGATAIRERVSASLSPNDDGSIDAVIQKVTAVETNDYTKTTTGAGIQTSVTAHKNVDPDDIATLGSAGVRERVSANLSPNDDGSVDAVVSKQTVVESSDTHETAAGTGGVLSKLYFGSNVDDGDEPAITAGYRKRHQISVTAKDDGSRDYAITEVTVQKVEDTGTIAPGVSTGIGRVVKVGRSVDPADLDTALVGLVPSATVEYDLAIQGNDDGTIDYTIREITKKAPTGEYNVGTALKSVLINVARNQESLADPTTPATRGVTKLLQTVLGDDGSVAYELRTITAQGDGSDATTKGGTILSAITQKHVSDGVTEADLDASASVVEGTAIQWQLVLNEDGSFNYVKSSAVSAALATASLNAVNLRPALDRYGYSDDIIYFENKKAADLAGYFIYTGTTYGQVDQFRINADGSYSGRAITRTYNGGTSGGGWGTGVQEPDDVIADARSTPSGAPPKFYYTYRIMWDANTGNTSGWIFRYKWEDYWTDDYGEAVNVIAGGIEPSSITKAVFANAEVWYAHTCREIAIDAFKKADGNIIGLAAGFVAEFIIGSEAAAP